VGPHIDERSQLRAHAPVIGGDEARPPYPNSSITDTEPAARGYASSTSERCAGCPDVSHGVVATGRQPRKRHENRSATLHEAVPIIPQPNVCALPSVARMPLTSKQPEGSPYCYGHVYHRRRLNFDRKKSCHTHLASVVGSGPRS
jgi:hypothetical protein